MPDGVIPSSPYPVLQEGRRSSRYVDGPYIASRPAYQMFAEQARTGASIGDLVAADARTQAKVEGRLDPVKEMPENRQFWFHDGEMEPIPNWPNAADRTDAPAAPAAAPPLAGPRPAPAPAAPPPPAAPVAAPVDAAPPGQVGVASARAPGAAAAPPSSARAPGGAAAAPSGAAGVAAAAAPPGSAGVAAAAAPPVPPAAPRARSPQPGGSTAPAPPTLPGSAARPAATAPAPDRVGRAATRRADARASAIQQQLAAASYPRPSRSERLAQRAAARYGDPRAI